MTIHPTLPNDQTLGNFCLTVVLKCLSLLPQSNLLSKIQNVTIQHNDEIGP